MSLATETMTLILSEASAGRCTNSLHFYTMNLAASVTAILSNLGLGRDVPKKRKMPWKGGLMRAGESVRPIFWANREGIVKGMILCYFILFLFFEAKECSNVHG